MFRALMLAAATWTTPHVLTMSDAGALVTLNPFFTQSAPTANLSELTMAWLLRWDEHNQPYPELAIAIPTRANGGISGDGLTITYHLRKNVRWSDGAPFTATDVVFSANALNNPANNTTSRFDQLKSIDAPDPYTVRFHLKKQYSTFFVGFFSSCCANAPILPAHLLAKYPNINDVPYNDLPVGIGPFKFDRWEKGKQVVLVPDPLYWRGLPKLRKIIYKIEPNRDALLAEVQRHNVDMWYQFSGAYLAPIQAVGGYTVYRQPSYAYNQYSFNLTHNVVADLPVRQALRLALNRPKIIAEIAHGVGVAQDSATPVQAPYYSDLGLTAYDPAAASKLLDADGWVRGADGIRAKAGVRLVLNVATTEGQPDMDRQLAVVTKDWNAIGVGVNVKHYPGTLYWAPANKGGIVYGDSWDLVTFAWAAAPDGDYEGLYGCDQFSPGGQNILHWCNQSAQNAMEALYGHYTQAERTADIKTLMRAIVSDVPTIVTTMREDLFAYNSDLRNYKPNSVTPFDNIMNVDI